MAEVAAAHPGVEIVGFADDYRFVGPAEQALAAAKHYVRLVEARGHVAQQAKAKLYAIETPVKTYPRVTHSAVKPKNRQIDQQVSRSDEGYFNTSDTPWVTLLMTQEAHPQTHRGSPS